MLTVTSENEFFDHYLKSKFQDKIYSYDQGFEKHEEKLIEFKGKHHDELRKFHQDTFKMKCLLSPLKIHIMNITLIENSKPRSIHLIRFSNNLKNN